MAAAKDLVLGCDFGTSSLKAALFDRHGTVVASRKVAYDSYRPAPGWVEQRPEDWWQAFRDAARELLRQEAAARVGAIGIAAQMAGAVAVDEAGQSLGNALIWLDTRSEAIARRITDGPIRIGGYGLASLARWLWLTNGAPNRHGRDPATKYLWLREQRPELWARLGKLLDVKDYLVCRATGRAATTADCAHLTWLMDSRRGHRAWSPRLIAHLGLSPALLPEIVPSTAAVGGLTGEAAAALGLEAGTPVAGGAGDLTAFALGAGRLSTGALHLQIGTSAWWGCHLAGRRVDPRSGIATIASAHPTLNLLVAAQETAGAAVEWAARALGFTRHGTADLEAFDRAAAAAAPGAQAPLFFPWLTGERVPVDDPELRGGFAGLELAHDRSALARAVLEGVGFNARWALAGIERLGGGDGAARFLGGGAASAVWGQLLADLLQRPLEVVEAPALGGARGAAMTAAVAAGWFADLETATAMSRVARRFEPDPAQAVYYETRFRRFRAQHKHMRRQPPD